MNRDRLQRELGYQFSNPALLEQALTHRSHSAQHNERFEFLGDALLETVISAYLYRNRPRTPEGDLTRLRASIVNREQLAIIARELDLGREMRLGQGEMKSGGHHRDSILADAVEALIAAVYLDSDFTTCEQTTLMLFAPALDALPDAQSLTKKPSERIGFLMTQPTATQPEHGAQGTHTCQTCDLPPYKGINQQIHAITVFNIIPHRNHFCFIKMVVYQHPFRRLGDVFLLFRMHPRRFTGHNPFWISRRDKHRTLKHKSMFVQRNGPRNCLQLSQGNQFIIYGQNILMAHEKTNQQTHQTIYPD